MLGRRSRIWVGQLTHSPERTNSTSPAGRPTARWSPSDSYEDMHDAQPLNTTINVGGRASPRDGASPPPAAGKIDMGKVVLRLPWLTNSEARVLAEEACRPHVLITCPGQQLFRDVA